MLHDYDRPTTPNENCRHPEAGHHHGTRRCYTLDGCKCDECQGARLRYDQLYALEGPYRTSAVMARLHVLALMEAGMGMKRIAKVSGLSNCTLGKLIYGHKGRRPSQKVNLRTEELLLNLPLDLADGKSVDRTEADLILKELLQRGWSKVAVAKAVVNPKATSLQWHRGQITAGSLRKLRRLLWEPVPARLDSWGNIRTIPVRQNQFIDPITRGVPEDPKLTLLAIEGQRRRDIEGLRLALEESRERDNRLKALLGGRLDGRRSMSWTR